MKRLLSLVALFVLALPASAMACGPYKGETKCELDAVGKKEVNLLVSEGVPRAEARKIVELQAKGITAVANIEQQRAYSGVYFAQGKFVVNEGPEQNESQSRSFTDEAGVTRSTEFRSVPRTWDQVQAKAQEVSAELHSQIMAQQVRVRTDPRIDGVRVEKANNAPVLAIGSSSSEAFPEVQVQDVAPEALNFPKPNKCKNHSSTAFEVDRYCDLPLRGGVEIEGSFSVCTSGFYAETRPFGSGTKLMLTAGHCFVGDEGTWITHNFSGGVIQMRMFFRDLNELGDTGALYLNGNPGAQRVILWGSAYEDYPIKIPPSLGSNAFPGMVECHSGITSGKQCGVVELTHQETIVAYGPGEGDIKVHETDVVCALSLEGDSGGPWYAYPGLATGIMIAGNDKPCDQGGEAIVYELHPALDNHELALAR